MINVSRETFEHACLGMFHVKHIKFIILDRDGVINEDSDDYIKTPDEWTPIPGSLEAIARLSHHGWRIVVATNQSGLARGLFDFDGLMRINAKMHQFVQEAGGHIDAVFFCSSKDNNHPDRKPNPGMLLDIADRLQSSPKSFIMIGDSARDVNAAQAAGIKPILVRTGKGQQTIEQWQGQLSIPVFSDLHAAVDELLLKSK